MASAACRGELMNACQMNHSLLAGAMVTLPITKTSVSQSAEFSSGYSAKFSAQFQSAEFFADGYEEYFSHLRQLIDFIPSSILRGLNRILDNRTLRSSLSGVQKEKDSTANATLCTKGQKSPLTDYCSDDALVLRWRRLISPCNAVTINCPVLSPSFFNASIASTTSCGALACIFCDLLFMWFLVISRFPRFICNPVYTKEITNKYLMCTPLSGYTVLHLNVVAFKNNKAQQCCSTSWASNHNVKGSYIMAIQQHTQTRLKFTFLIASGTQRLVDIHPMRLISVQGVSHV
ncbi:hypothetical protein XIS1_850027 [Xenorhabdus innexi]|uniref:Uncharacterized protein n=1 Tax=Xenorhabdus innexi TaxID=290109 RepID=A0A1N6N144_9GAMM|nr:hypothetical protein Xinn_03013 [Xenorhabdus innexi]SIP74821.1 hypothetical protein XIS1_850027 [Xenorhabdus innexi]